MNNDEKILAMLETLTVDVRGMKSDIAEIKEDIGAIKEDVAALQYNVGKIGTWAERVSPKVDIGVYDGD